MSRARRKAIRQRVDRYEKEFAEIKALSARDPKMREVESMGGVAWLKQHRLVCLLARQYLTPVQFASVAERFELEAERMGIYAPGTFVKLRPTE